MAGCAGNAPGRNVLLVRSTRLNPVGVGLAVAGSCAAILSIFLPLVQTPGFAGVASNSLIQNEGAGTGISLRIVLLAVIAMGLTYRYYRRGRGSWGVIVCGVLLVVGAFVDANNDEITTLYLLDDNGELLGEGDSWIARLGIALYVTGVGGALTAVGGVLMMRDGERVASGADDGAAWSGAPDGASAATKTCPDCAETVLAAANVCKHCGYRFDQETVPHQP